jgi:bacteriophage exclusion system BrxC/D-like protein
MPVQELSAFKSSPFSLLADETTAACWAGRKQTLSQLRRLCTAWSNRADSSLDVMWANLGAGKTHALFHLKYLLSAASNPGPIVTFVDVPEDIGNFLDLYRKVLPTLPLPKLAELGLKSRHGKSRLFRAFRAMIFGAENEQQLAYDWITGARPGLRELKAVTGIDSRIETDSDAESVLSELIRLSASNGQRFVILLDEFQRVGHIKTEKKRDALLAHVRTLFSRNPTHLSMVLAIGSRLEKTALDLLPAELRTIMGMRPSIALPEMSKDEALEFVRKRFEWYRPTDYTGTAEHPFTAEQIDLVLSYLTDEAKTRLIPRTILQVLGIVEDNFLAQGEVSCTQNDLVELLKSLRWDDT